MQQQDEDTGRLLENVVADDEALVER